MPHEADGTGMSTLLWLICVYWNLVWFTQQITALGQAENGEPPNQAADGQARPPRRGTPIASLTAAAAMQEILKRDGVASLDAFVGKALAVYESVVSAFDAGDRDALSRLLSAEVYEAFSATIAEREELGEAVETLFSRIEPEIVDARIDKGRMEVAIRFASESFKLPRRPAGLLFHNVSTPLHGKEVWTFARSLAGRDDDWRIVSTQTEG